MKEFTWNGSWMQTNEVHYIYDGNLVVQERDANNLPLVTYVRGTDLSGSFQGAGGIGGLLARTDNSKLLISDSFATSFYHADGNGNVTCLTYPNGTIAAKYLYDPYGNMLSMYGSLADANTYHFSSKEWNANSGLYYYLYRLYDPNTQRWLNRDPIKERGGLNLYQFVRNQTISLVDKSGLNFWEDPYSPIYPNNPPFPTPPPNPALDKARDWLKKCHSELCPGGANVLNLPIGYLPGGGEEGSSILPGIIIIDFPSMKGDPSNFVRTLAHECMHKRDGFLHGEWDYWFNGDADHTQIFNDADKIQREYDSDPEGKKCDKCKK